jgi:hypothetical protein
VNKPIAIRRPTAMTIENPEDIPGPNPLNFIYRDGNKKFMNTPNALMPTAFIIDGPCWMIKRNTAFHRSCFESQLEIRDIL